MTEATGLESGAGLIQSAKALKPEIERCADAVEANSCFPNSLVEAIANAGLFKILVPKTLGGTEVDPATFVRVIEEVSRVDGSVGWGVCFGAAGGIAAGFLPIEAARRVFEKDSQACLAASLALAARSPSDNRPPDRAVAIEGGYRVSGRWPFASGCLHATWLFGSCPIFDGDQPRIRPDGRPETRYFFFPRENCEIIDNWNVIGLRGSESNDYAVVDAFVPDELTLTRDEPIKPHHPGPLYRFGGETLVNSAGMVHAPFPGVASIGMAGICLGIAQGAFDSYLELARVKISIVPQVGGLTNPLSENLLIQDQVGRSKAILDSARGYLYNTIATIWNQVVAEGRSGPEHGTMLRLASTHAAVAAAEVVNTVWNIAGSSSIYVDGPFERRYRDIHVATQNFAIRAEHFATAGKMLLETEDRF